MNRPLAILLGIVGALVCVVPLLVARFMSVVHITVQEEAIAGVVAAIGFLLMLTAFLSTRSIAVIACEVVTIVVVLLIWAQLMTMTSRSPQKRSMAEIRTIAIALEARATDVNEYPVAHNMDEIERYLVPTYLKEMPRQDGYRNGFRYESWQVDPHQPGPDHYAVASAGRDWKWEKRSLRDYTPQITHSVDCDIVYVNGAFVTYPEGFQNDAAPQPVRVAPKAPTEPKELFEQATSLYRADKFNEAIPLFEQYLQTNPNDALAAARIGMSLAQVDRLQEAIPYLPKASALDPTDYQSRSNLGLVYEKLKRPEEGIAWERQADKIKPNDAKVLNNLGFVLMRGGQKAEAIPIFERAIRLAPKEKLYRDNLKEAKSGRR